MDTDALTAGVLKELRAPHPAPVLSLTMPTHRRAPENAQDAVRLRNLVTEAANRLDADPRISREDAAATKRQLDLAVSELDPRRALDALVLFAGPDEHRIWSLPRTVPERVVLADTYLTRNLVAAKAQARPYWVLTVAADHATLWSGTPDALRPEKTGGFPLTAPREDPNPQREERIGDTPSTFTDEETRTFFRTVDEKLRGVLAADPRPLYLVGLAPALSLLDDVGESAAAAVGRVAKGAPADLSPSRLAAELRPALDAQTVEAAAGVRARLDTARGGKLFAGGLDEVWSAVQEGRVALLAVEEHFRRSARTTGGHVELVPEDEAVTAGDPDVYEDFVDELAEAALDSGAEVVFTVDGALSQYDGIAAALRY
ncbi:chemotaxis protein [uncultured Streptomyces sp.]|uniref:baeRF3 domain-containing protein n=1 Tax=uncultured Streptomyces sp. TaxID=174707 RepID=UPI002635DDDA|nr:chemotaxis protein [uncultured Streptomyces sp.]